MARQAGGHLNGCSIDGVTPFLYTEGMELDTRLPAYTKWFGFQVPRYMLEALGFGDFLKISGPVRCESAQLAGLSQTLMDSLKIFSELAIDTSQHSNRAPLVKSLNHGILAAFAATFSESQPADRVYRHNYRKCVEQTVAYIEAYIDQPIRISDIYVTTGLNYKTLERAFNTVMGISPQRYLTMQRLSRARQMLRSNEPDLLNVSDIATSCGCFHLGRFSQEYRKLFHELPSDTINKRSFS